MKTYGLIGKRLDYSFSRVFFESFFEENKIDAEYRNFEIPYIDDIEKVFELPISGLNVTIPYKESVIPFLSDLSEEANSIAAVNCIQFVDNRKIGHNTDAFGFHQSIKPFLTNKHERALILGTGGAAKAVYYVLKNLGIDVTFISRNPEGKKEFGYEEMNSHMLNACKLIVNCTPIGTYPDVEAEILLPYRSMTDEHLVVDLIYNPPLTALLEKSKEAGATILNGESMLKHQAIKSWKIWNNES